MWYQTPGYFRNSNGSSTNLTKALQQGNRAEAWYQIRYGSANNGNNGNGVVVRRYAESEVFGLYNPGSVTLDDARQTYRMFTLHRPTIQKYEARFGIAFDGTLGTTLTQAEDGVMRPPLVASNIRYNLTGINFVDAIQDELTPARNTLFAALQTQYAVGMAGLTAADFSPTNIYLDPNRDTVGQTPNLLHAAYLNSSINPLTGAEVATRDILIGEDGNDILYGGKGDDVLIGGKGLDYYIWNTGDGNDRIIDEDKQGLIVINNGTPQDLYASGAFVKQGTSNIWTKTTPSGTITLTHNSPWKIITPDGSEILLGDDFVDGDFGIRLLDAPTLTAPPPTDLTIVGDFKPADQDLSTAGIDEGYDALDNLIVGTVADLDREDVLYDSFGNDHILGKGGNDTLYAWRGGDDLLDGGAGQDWLAAVAGNDRLIGGTDSDVLLGGVGDDQFFGKDAIPDLAGYILAAETHGSSGNRGDWLDGSDGADTLVGEVDADLMLGGEGEDLLIGGGGNDNMFGDQSGSADINWTATRSIQVAGDFTTYSTDTTHGGRAEAALGGADVIYGGAGDDWIEGGQGNDIIDAGADNDVVFGGQGADVILGQGGNDVLTGSAGFTDPLGDGADYIDGGDGNDSLWGAGGNDTLLGGIGNDELVGDGDGTSLADEGADILDGGAGDDKLWGSGKDDLLLGGDGSDELRGEADNDTLDGGTGADKLWGGAGDDVLDGGAGDDQLVGGADNDSLTGDVGADKLWGDAGNDILDGGEGADYLEGGSGDDTYLNVTGEDTVLDTEGNNTIVLATALGVGADGLSNVVQTNADGSQYAQLTITLDTGEVLKLDSPYFAVGSTTIQFAGGDALDLETLVGTTLATPLNLINNDNGGRVYGGAGGDVLSGGAGSDTLVGYLGNDTLQGGAGNDILDGGTGADALAGGAGDDTYLNVTGDDTIYDIEGNDTIALSATGLDAGGLTAASLTDANGQTYTQLQLALDTGGTLKLDSPFFAHGSTTLQFANGNLLDLETLVGTTLTAPLNLQLGNNGGKVYGGAGADFLYGGSGNDTLAGHDGNDTLSSNMGDDVLDGGAGDDILYGGAGNDTYRYSGGRDTLIDSESGNTLAFNTAPGVVTLGFQTSIYGTQDLSLTLADGSGVTIRDGFLGAIDTFDLGGTSQHIGELLDTYLPQAVSITGTYAGNSVYGGAGGDVLSGLAGDDALYSGQSSDTLDGGDGADILVGGRGDDLLAGGTGGDTYRFGLGDGSDTVIAAAPSDTNADVLQLGLGIAAADLSGFRLANGDLLLRINGTQDSVKFEGWFTTGPVVASVRFADNSELSATAISAMAVDGFGGTTQDDVLTGTAANDRVLGYGGNDTLTGAAGDDVLEGGAGADIYRFGWSSMGADIVVELPSEASTILLTEGAGLADMKHARVGDDLRIALRGTTATLTLTDYFVSSQVWTIQDGGGATTSVADWLALPVATADIQSVRADFLEEARALWANKILNVSALYKRVDGDTYQAQSTGAGSSDTTIQNFTVLNYASDAASISRQSFGENYASSRVEVTQAPTGGSMSTYISLEMLETLLPLLSTGGGISTNGLLPVYGPSSGSSLSMGGGQNLIGFTTLGNGPVPSNAIPHYFNTTTTNDTRVEQINGGNSDNVISGNVLAPNPYSPGNFFPYSPGNTVTLIDGGGGNDTLYAPGFFGVPDIGLSSIGGLSSFLYGNAGDDKLYGSGARDTLAGGAGSDYLDGSAGADTYVVFAGDAGTDVVWDSGVPIRRNGPGGHVLASDYSSLQTAYYAYLGIDPSAPGVILPPLPAANDYAVLSNLANLGAIPMDTVKLVGMRPGDLVFTWSQRALESMRDTAQTYSYEYGGYTYTNTIYGQLSSQTMHAVLNLSWVAGESIDVIIPNSTDLIGMGVERFVFDDGTVLSMADMLGLAGAHPTLNPQDNDNVIVGGAAQDVIFGEGGNDLLYGGDGDDTLNGGTGNDILTGGAGNDTYVVDSTTDIITENLNEGSDNVESSVTYTLTDNVEGLRLMGVVEIDGTGNGLSNSLNGNDAANTLNGLDGDDTLSGGAGDDTLIGGTGSDTLYGETGADILIGGVGDDIYAFWRANDFAQDTVRDIDTTPGNIDTLQMVYGVAPTSVSVNRTATQLVLSLNSGEALSIDWNPTTGVGIEQVTFTNGTVWDVAALLALANHAPVVTAPIGSLAATESLAFSFVLPETVFADVDTGAWDTLTYSVSLMDGNALPGWLTFDAATRTIAGNPTDLLAGDYALRIVATDTMGAVAYDDFVLTVEDTVATIKNGTPGAETLDGTRYKDMLIGLGGNDVLNGYAANDTLDGGTGNDNMSGGLGDDTYIVDSITDVITENLNEGIDTVESSITLTLGANIENLMLTGTPVINGTGNTLANVLVGNSAINTLTGGAGNDRLDGRGGADKMLGGTGDDTYVVDVSTDAITEKNNEGIDSVETSVTLTLASNVENLILTGTTAINGTGNTLNNVLTGNSVANTLSGGTGADTLIGGAGNDTYVLDNTLDVVTENLNEGIDLVQSSVTTTLTTNVENLTLTGNTALNGTGNTLDNVLTGNGANNSLVGGAGNDRLDGGTGSDIMLGGIGNDMYVVNVATDSVTENLNEGIDSVESGVTLTLGANVENLLLTGTTAINGTGNALDNMLTGNGAVNTLTGGAGNDRLDGKAGADKMLGGVGDDTYVVDVTTDVITENLNEGTDSVETGITYIMGANVENLTLTGSSAINATGNTLNNILKGNSTANSLTGGAGNDTLEGMLGADTLAGGTGNDTYLLSRGYGIDTIFENDTTTGNTDVAQFLSGVAADQIWFQHTGNNLEVSIIGTADKLVVKDWYLGTANHVEQFKTTDGAKTLLDSQVDNLVNAMASFAPPAAGQTTLPPAYQTSLSTVIATNWQ